MKAPATGAELSSPAQTGVARSPAAARRRAPVIPAAPLAAWRRGARRNLFALRGGVGQGEPEPEGPIEDATGFGESKRVAGSAEHDRGDVDPGRALHVRSQAVARLVDEAGLPAGDGPLASEQAVGVHQVVNPPI